MKNREKGVVLLVMCIAVIFMAQAPAPSYKVIVQKDNPDSSLSKSQVAKFFLKTATKWENGDHVVPVDKTRDDPVRIAFSEEIVKKRARAVEAYWRKQIFSGRGIPPAQIIDDTGIANYVDQNPGAIGYVSADFDISSYDLKVLTLRDE